MNTSFNDARVYVGTYAKYNDGSLCGEWLDLADFGSYGEFMEACGKLHADEADPEFMFQDWEGIPSVFVSEYGIDETFFGLMSQMEDFSEEEAEAFFVWVQWQGLPGNAEKLVEGFYDAYVGKYESQIEFAENLVAECMDLPEWAAPYFDYSQFAYELFCSDYYFEDGFVFHSC